MNKFLGKVNGKEYDTVEEYNEAIKEALKNGQLNSCEASVQDTNTDEPEGDETDTNAHITPLVTVSYDVEGAVKDVQLDFMCQLDQLRSKMGFKKFHESFDSTVLKALNEELTQYLPQIDEYIANYSKDPLVIEGYLDDVSHILNLMYNVSKNLTKEEADLQKSLADVQARVKVLETAQKFYMDVSDKIESAIVKEASLKEGSEENEPELSTKECGEEYSKDQLTDEEIDQLVNEAVNEFNSVIDGFTSVLKNLLKKQ